MTRLQNQQRKRRQNAFTRARNGDLHNLVALNQQQITRMMPVKPDIVFPREGPRDKLFTFWESIPGSIIQGNLTETDFAITLTASQLPNLNGSLSAVFDVYRINAIKIAFHPFLQSASSAAGPTTTVIDYDDASTLPIVNLLQYESAQTVPAGVYFERTFTPRVSTALYSGVFTSFGQQKHQWVDMASLGVIHYGLKGGVAASAAAGFNLWSPTIAVCYQCKNTR